jgi:dTDP-4-amino-4,6-dideoxygalactose transaminase
MEWRVPLADIDFGPEEEEAAGAVIHGRWLSMGAITRQFEQEFASFIGARHALAVTNATAALHLACLAVGIGAGDEVILPSLTFVATANAVRYTGARPVFADIESLEHLTISPESIQAAITQHTRAILVMHYAGYACDMPAIQKIAREHGLFILEDSAHAIGSTLDGRSLGTWGQVGCYSFFSNKNMTTGEGGMLVTDDDAIAEKVTLQRSHGMTSLSWDRHQGHAFSYDVVELGYNYRIDEMRSALGRIQLGRLPAGNLRRKELARLYRELLNEKAGEVKLPFAEERGIPYPHLMPTLLPVGVNRLQFMESMKRQGIQTSIHYPPVHQFSIYQADWLKAGLPLPLTEEAAARQVTLPLFPTMRDEQVHWVVQAVRQALQEQDAV